LRNLAAHAEKKYLLASFEKNVQRKTYGLQKEEVTGYGNLEKLNEEWSR
jgi:hypothetical protein